MVSGIKYPEGRIRQQLHLHAPASQCGFARWSLAGAAPADATKANGIWYTADNAELGPVIWGAFATIQSVYNDSDTGEHGIEYLSPVGTGFGKWK